MGDELVSAEEARELHAEAVERVAELEALYSTLPAGAGVDLTPLANERYIRDLARTVIAQDERIRNLSAWADELAEELQEATARAERAEGERDEWEESHRELVRWMQSGDPCPPYTGRMAWQLSRLDETIGTLKTGEEALRVERNDLEAERDRLARIIDCIGLLNPEGIPCHCFRGWATVPSPSSDGVGCRDCGGSAGKPGTRWLILPADDARDPSDA